MRRRGLRSGSGSGFRGFRGFVDFGGFVCRDSIFREFASRGLSGDRVEIDRRSEIRDFGFLGQIRIFRI